MVGLEWKLIIDSWEEGKGRRQTRCLVILPKACTVVRIDSSVWPRDTGSLPCRLQTDWMLDAPYSELDEADVGLRHIVLRWQCPAGVSSVMGCGGWRS